MARLQHFGRTIVASLKQGLWLAVFFVPYFYYFEPKSNVLLMLALCFGSPVFLGVIAAILALLTEERIDRHEDARRFGASFVGFAGIVLFQTISKQAASSPDRLAILGSIVLGLFATSIGVMIGIDNAKSSRRIGRTQVLVWTGVSAVVSILGFRRYGIAGALNGLGVLCGSVCGTLLGAGLSAWMQELSDVIEYLRRMKTLLGAFIAGYAAIVFVFAGMYAAVWQHNHYSLSLGTDARFGDFFYFSLVTAATLGYGDIVPLSPAARVLACVQVVISVGWTTIVLAIVASLVQNRGILNGVRLGGTGKEDR
jgi:hypothetical protein